MTALDSNILVRVVAADDPAQTRAAQKLLGGGGTFFIADVVLVELVWVLQRLYAFQRSEIVTVLSSFLGRGDVVFENEARVRDGVKALAAGADLADRLVVDIARAHACERMASFDDGLVKRHPDFVFKP
jgi:predicted nucleic-acid-binding protein